MTLLLADRTAPWAGADELLDLNEKLHIRDFLDMFEAQLDLHEDLRLLKGVSHAELTLRLQSHGTDMFVMPSRPLNTSIWLV